MTCTRRRLRSMQRRQQQESVCSQNIDVVFNWLCDTGRKPKSKPKPHLLLMQAQSKHAKAHPPRTRGRHTDQVPLGAREDNDATEPQIGQKGAQSRSEAFGEQRDRVRVDRQARSPVRVLIGWSDRDRAWIERKQGTVYVRIDASQGWWSTFFGLRRTENQAMGRQQ